jgi:hypothetical protein
MRDYTKIEAWRLVRLNYLAEEQADALARQTKLTFACLHGRLRKKLASLAKSLPLRRVCS